MKEKLIDGTVTIIESMSLGNFQLVFYTLGALMIIYAIVSYMVARKKKSEAISDEKIEEKQESSHKEGDKE